MSMSTFTAKTCGIFAWRRKSTYLKLNFSRFIKALGYTHEVVHANSSQSIHSRIIPASLVHAYSSMLS